MNAGRKVFLTTAAPYALIAALLGIALIPTMPYGYYGVMRWIVCGAFLFLAARAHEREDGAWTWTWVIAAGIYNPVFRVVASRDVWTVVNAVTIAMVCIGYWRAAAMQLRRPEQIEG